MVVLVLGVVVGAALVLATVEVVGRPTESITVYSTLPGKVTETTVGATVTSTTAVTVFETVTASGNSTSYPGLVVESGTLTVPTGNGTGSLAVSISNQMSVPLTEITVTPDQSTLSLNGENPGAGWVMASGVSIQPGTIYSGQTSVSAPGDDLTAGTTYIFTVAVTFEGGGNNVQTLSFTAQA